MSDTRITGRPALPPPATPPPGPKPPYIRGVLQAVGGVALGGLVGFAAGLRGGFYLSLVLAVAGAAYGGWCGWLFAFSNRPRALRVRDEALPAGERPRPPPDPLPRSEAIATAPSSKPRVDRIGGHGAAITGLALSPDGAFVASCDRRGAVIVHDLKTGYQVWAARDFEAHAVDLVYSGDGRLLVVAGHELFRGGPGSINCSVRVYDALNGREFRRLEFTDDLTCITFVGDGHHLLIGGVGVLRLWDLEMPAEHFVEKLRWLKEKQMEAPAALAFHRGLVLIGCSQGADVRVTTIPASDQGILLFLGHQFFFSPVRYRSVVALAVSPSGQHVLSGGLDGYARIWALRTGQELRRFDGHFGWWGWHGVTGVGWLSEDEAVSTGEDGTLRRWDTRTGAELARFDHGGSIQRLSVVGRTAATGANDGTIRLWALT